MLIKNKTLILLLALATCYSCTNKKNENIETFQEYEKPETSNEIQKMRLYHYSAKVENGNQTYLYDIVREAEDSLPHVENENGERFADNKIRLRINRDDNEIFDKEFTKESFASYLEKDFIKHSILEGMAFDKVIDGKLRFAVSVCYPQSDMYVPLSITIASDGSYIITKDTTLDTSSQEEDSLSI